MWSCRSNERRACQAASRRVGGVVDTLLRGEFGSDARRMADCARNSGLPLVTSTSRMYSARYGLDVCVHGAVASAGENVDLHVWGGSPQGGVVFIPIATPGESGESVATAKCKIGCANLFALTVE